MKGRQPLLMSLRVVLMRACISTSSATPHLMRVIISISQSKLSGAPIPKATFVVINSFAVGETIALYVFVIYFILQVSMSYLLFLSTTQTEFPVLREPSTAVF